ncbi:cytochrome P450 [Halegenticoccus tardaugens]|uniref:cytochrome P450 n=1 Tax=Halegenticoccus tardaugens TaxID=2071624 RepID=UPI00100B9C19|nr:cytochrome P450 [Halegenticoccus tardaugens]
MRATPPGPKQAPLLGNTRQFFRDSLSFMTACREAYGDVSRFRVGSTDLYLIANPADIQRVLATEAAHYRKPTFQDSLNEVLGDGLLLNEGNDLWERQRRRAQPAFQIQRVLHPEATAALTRYTKELLAEWRPGETIDIHSEMLTLTLKAIGKLMFDVEFENAEIQRIRKNLEPLGQEFEPNFLQALLPDWAPTPPNPRFQAGLEGLRQDMLDLVDQRLETTNPTANETEEPADFLTVMLRAFQREADVDEDLLRDELITILLAGQDTTALALTYTLTLLAEHPEIEVRLHEELVSTLGEGPIMPETLFELSSLDRIIKESLRMYPPVHAMAREPRLDVRLGGYRIPKGAGVLLSQWVTHRDPRWYTEPETFDPDRWQTERRATRPGYAYFPFGGGPRVCIGKTIAVIEIKLILATILRQYRFERASDEPIELEPVVTMQPKGPVEMVVREWT